MYGTVTDANTYFTTQRLDISDIWVSETLEHKTAALNQAAQIIDRLNYHGDRASTSQTAEFPRDSDTEVPTDVEYAAYEIAFNLLSGRDPDREIEQQHVESGSYGPARLRKDAKFVPEHILHGVPSAAAWNLLLPYFRDGLHLTITRVD